MEIDVRHPRSGDLLGSKFAIAGLGTAFEGTVGWQLESPDGEKLQEGSLQGGSMGPISHFIGEIELASTVSRPTQATLLVYGDNPALPDEGESPGIDTNRIPVVLVPGSYGFVNYTVKPGDTLSKIVKGADFGESSIDAIVAANSDLIQDPDHIEAGWTLRIPLS